MAVKTVEIDETEFLNNQKIKQVVEQMLAHPEARKLVQKAQKLVNPNITTPQDYQQEVLDKIEEEKKERLAWQKEQQEKADKAEADAKLQAFKDSWDRQKAALRRQGYMDDGIAAIEKLAQERGIPDLEAAEALFVKMNPPQEVVTPSGGHGGSFNLFEPSEKDGDEMKVLLETRGESEQVLNKMIGHALADARSGRRAA